MPLGRKCVYSALRVYLLFAVITVGGCSSAGNAPPEDSDSPPDGTNPSDGSQAAIWSTAFDATGVGVLSAVWGSSADDVFVVGGKPSQGEIYHFDGAVWQAMHVPEVPLLVWVFGFGSDDVTAVGVGGGVVHFDGASWQRLESGTIKDLWGIWGSAPDDLWIVGGGDGEAVILHFDGTNFTPTAMPANDRDAKALFKVWGIGSKIFAVGENGLIIQYQAGGPAPASWLQVPAGANADDDFISLWGTSADNIVAVGGRSSARVAVYDGTTWTTHKPAGVPGLNAVTMVGPNEAVVGGVDGYAGSYNPQTGMLTSETAETTLTLHGLWNDGLRRTYGVGGQFFAPYSGLALVRTLGDPRIVPLPPLEAPADCSEDVDCSDGEVCNQGECLPESACDDTDGDGVCDSDDPCPLDDPDDTDGDGICDSADPCPLDDLDDSDGDGVCDSDDPCPLDNPDDTDGDGVCDSLDPCPLDKLDDSDGDGVCDSADVCASGDDNVDSDGDGVPDFCDPCPDDNPDDTDGDGVCDSADLCPGADDNIDTDGDGIPNGCDTCEGSPFDLDGDGEVGAGDLAILLGNWGPCSPPSPCPADFNGDGQVNAADLAQVLGFWGVVDDGEDTDGDGVQDACDICPGFDDGVDADGDGVPDGCDLCPDGNDSVDTDGDGVPDDCDDCPNDNPDDSDGDGICDSKDPCPADNPNDTDGDGVCDSDDVCPGFDDNVDSDGNGVPDGCCAFETDCELGEVCDVDGFCVPATGPDLEIGVGVGAGGGEFACIDGPYAKLVHGGALTLCEGFQGIVEMWLSLRLTGFPPNATVEVTRSVSLAEHPCTEVEDCDAGLECIDGYCTPFGAGPTLLPLTDVGDGVNELFGLLYMIFLSADYLDGQEIIISMSVADQIDPSITASLDLNVIVSVDRFCFGDEFCPAGQTCVDGYCE